MCIVSKWKSEKQDKASVSESNMKGEGETKPARKHECDKCTASSCLQSSN